MKCANTEALNAYMDKQQKEELAYNSFFDDIQDKLDELYDKIEDIKKIAENYQGYDFVEDLVETIKDEI